jgi:hypothetical protein
LCSGHDDQARGKPIHDDWRPWKCQPCPFFAALRYRRLSGTFAPLDVSTGTPYEQNNIANSCGRAFTTGSSENSEPHRMPSRLWVPADVLQPRQPLLPPPSAPRGRHGPAGSVLASVGEPVDDPKGGEETGTRTCANNRSRQLAWTGRGRGAVPLIGPRSAVGRPSVVAKMRPAQKSTPRNTMPVAQQVAKP